MTRRRVTKPCNKCFCLLPGAFNAILLIIRQQLLKYVMTFKGLNNRRPSVCLHVCAVSTTKAWMYLEKTKSLERFQPAFLTPLSDKDCGAQRVQQHDMMLLLLPFVLHICIGNVGGTARWGEVLPEGNFLACLLLSRQPFNNMGWIEWSKAPLLCKTLLKLHVWAKWKTNTGSIKVNRSRHLHVWGKDIRVWECTRPPSDWELEGNNGRKKKAREKF